MAELTHALEELRSADEPLFGGKSTSLGDMISETDRCAGSR